MAPLVPVALSRVDMLIHKLLEPRIQCSNVVADLKTHTVFLLLILVSTEVWLIHTHHFGISAEVQPLLLPREQ